MTESNQDPDFEEKMEAAYQKFRREITGDTVTTEQWTKIIHAMFFDKDVYGAHADRMMALAMAKSKVPEAVTVNLVQALLIVSYDMQDRMRLMAAIVERFMKKKGEA